ncbi:MAG: hypothetical protein CMP54_02635 [Flavobacteriales bacterium]|nr:hypothetical protein [Flavobacteriales bacterium]
MKLSVLIIRLTFILCFCYANALAQNGTLRGIVYDEILEPAMGATILVEQTDMYAVSDINGLFIIPDIPFGTYKLKVSYIGYGSQIIDVNIKQKNSALLKIYLQEESTKLQNINLNSERQERKNEVNVSVLKLTSKTIKKLPGIG